MRPMLEHVLAGIQYALGDLKADDKPRKVSRCDAPYKAQSSQSYFRASLRSLRTS